MEALLSEKSKKIISLLLLEPQIKASVFEKLDHADKYKMYTIQQNGDIVLGETRFSFWNNLIGCQRTIPFESFALKVWEALVNLSTGINQKAIIEGLSREIVMKAVKEKDFDWITERLYNIATMVAQKSSIADGVGADPEGSRVLGPRLNASAIDKRDIIININGRKKVCHFKDCIGDPMIDVELGIVGINRVYPELDILEGMVHKSVLRTNVHRILESFILKTDSNKLRLKVRYFRGILKTFRAAEQATNPCEDKLPKDFLYLLLM